MAQNARQFTIESIGITSVTNQTYNITNIVLDFTLYESINNPYMLGEITIHDSRDNMLGNMPIQGQERVSIRVKTETFSEKIYEYDMTVCGINVRTAEDRHQIYTLNLISFEGLKNEGIRIGKTIEGTADEIVAKILKEHLNTKKKLDAEPERFPRKFLPSLKRPFDFIYQLSRVSVSSSSSVGKKGGATSNSGSVKNDSVTEIETNSMGKLSGTAGYLFFETYDGYVFKSLDKIASSGDDNYGGTKPKYTYTYGVANSEETDRFNHLKILNYTFANEMDVLKQLRQGIYSTMCIFFDVNTCTYEENMYKVEDTYAQMSHLGSSTKIPVGAKELSKYPTRIMTQMINHEIFHDDKETSGKSDAEYKDNYKYSIAQSNARYKLASNQQINITIPCNLTIRAGDKLELLFPNMTSEEARKLQPYDEEHSGNYLIKDIAYKFIIKGPQPFVGTTHVSLVRDSMGRKNTASKVK
jgi:hypothetical protein